jgi:hypothetical protein
MRCTPFLRNLPPPVKKAAQPSTKLLERVRRPGYLNKLVHPEELAPLFKVRARRVFKCLNMDLIDALR